MIKNQEVNLVESFSQLAKGYNMDKPTTIKIIQDVFKTVIKKKYGEDSNFEIVVNVDKGDLEITRMRLIVDDEFAEDSFDYNENLHISLTEARKFQDDFELDEDYTEIIKLEDFDRRSILLAKQTLFQKIKDVDGYNLIERYEELVGEIIFAEVIGFDSFGVILQDSLGKEILLPKSEQIKGDRFFKGDTVKALVLKVQMYNNKPQVILSRSNSLFLTKLMEFEIPEINNGLILIRNVVRIAGEKSKVVVESYDDRIDPVGTIVGSKGVKIIPIMKELNNEYIDIINYSDNFDLFLKRAISPAKITSYDNTKDKIVLYLPTDQIGLAYGKGGTNIKLVSELLNKKVEIFREIEVDEDDVELTEFSDEIENWIIDEFKKIGLDTAKQVLSQDIEYLVKKTDLEEEVIYDVINILKSEFSI